jgi:hypothetical protein
MVTSLRSCLEGAETIAPEIIQRGTYLGESLEIDSVKPTFRVDPNVHKPGFAQELQMRARG